MRYQIKLDKFMGWCTLFKARTSPLYQFDSMRYVLDYPKRWTDTVKICRACGQNETWCSVYTGCSLNKGNQHNLLEIVESEKPEKDYPLTDLGVQEFEADIRREEIVRITTRLRKIADQCEAGGHKSRARMFRAIAKSFEDGKL